MPCVISPDFKQLYICAYSANTCKLLLYIININIPHTHKKDYNNVLTRRIKANKKVEVCFHEALEVEEVEEEPYAS